MNRSITSRKNHPNRQVTRQKMPSSNFHLCLIWMLPLFLSRQKWQDLSPRVIRDGLFHATGPLQGGTVEGKVTERERSQIMVFSGGKMKGRCFLKDLKDYVSETLSALL